MNLNQPPPEKQYEFSATHYSAMGSIHPMSPYESSEAHARGTRGVPEAMLDWLAQLVTKSSNPQRTLEQFQKLNPPIFKGEADPLQAKVWLRQIEKILKVMKCSEDQKVLFSTFMFQKEAEYWWEIVSKNAEITGEEITWKFLVDKFT